MINEQLWLLLSLKLTGEANEQELEALNKMLQENPQWSFHVELFTQAWHRKTVTSGQTDDSFNRHLQRLSLHRDQDNVIVIPEMEEAVLPSAAPDYRGGKKYKWFMAAASVLLLSFVGLKYFMRGDEPLTNNKPSAQNTVITKRGSKSTIHLPDGTKVWLNSDTWIRYDELFRGENREVVLEGEAFFDVVKDAQHPFIIHTKTVDIKVLGTSFNVRAYANEKATETSLIRGEVEVTLLKNPEKKIVLRPNEKLLVNHDMPDPVITGKVSAISSTKQDISITVGKVHFEKQDSTALEAMWTKNKLVFDAETLEEVAKKIERWYDVLVVIQGDENVKEAEYTGIFENESLAQVMQALKITGNFDYTISKNLVNIR